MVSSILASFNSQPRRFLRDEQAGTIPEYAIVLALLIAVIAGSLIAFGPHVSDSLTTLSDVLPGADGTGPSGQLTGPSTMAHTSPTR